MSIETLDARKTNALPEPGEIVRVRSRTYLVESGDGSTASFPQSVSLACIDDDAQGEQLEVIWDLELDKEILGKDSWREIGKKGFDDSRFFSAFIHTLRWNCVTATTPNLFQSPFRAGIRIDAYQLDPLRKALLLPRVNMFIADDVGLGKTIEAGLIATELLLRRRIREIVVVCPPTMQEQWRDELDNRFGLIFETLNREYIERTRQERGYGVNPWTTFPRFIISERLLTDETYAGPFRDWLDNLRPATLLIFDEAHHAAPSSGARYAIDSKITRAIRDLAPRFEHRLFLSATPHNGHSNSFSALLELLDPQRFTRGVKVSKSSLRDVMVRRLKEDVREVAGGFPRREVVQEDISGLPPDAPELMLSALLNEYRNVRQKRVEGESRRRQAQAGIIISHLQQRLLSSCEAFARTLAVHRRTMERIWAGNVPKPTAGNQRTLEIFQAISDADDDRSQLSEEEQTLLTDLAIEDATLESAADSGKADIAREKSLLDQMQNIAEAARGLPDARIRKLIAWIAQHLCAGAHDPLIPPMQQNAPWADMRLIIFTEWEDTLRYIVRMLTAALSGTELAEHRIEIFHGPTPPLKREAIKRAFNLPPEKHPLRILVANDAAREGLNLQAHCNHLFHFDVPWNPSRIEQRNGRIDRKLQPAEVVYCHYFFYTQRPEDPVLQALVRKIRTIHDQLGSLAAILEGRIANTLQNGIRHEQIKELEKEIDTANLDSEKQAIVEEELEAARERQNDLRKQVDGLRNRINDARAWIGLENEALKDALSCSLELMGAQPLASMEKSSGIERFSFPNLAERFGTDPTWSLTLDTLRAPPENGARDFSWRRESAIRPVVFDAPATLDESVVQLHLQHRIVQRLLSRFASQGFIHHDLSRACLTQSQDAIPRVVVLGRLSLYGKGAVRLHEEILTASARWIEPQRRKSPLSPYGREAEAKTLSLLETELLSGKTPQLTKEVQALLASSLTRDLEELVPHLETRGEELRREVEAALNQRGIAESESLRRILEDQKKRVIAESGRIDSLQLDLFSEQERRQVGSNRKYWDRWLQNVESDLKREPGRIVDFYKVSTYRIEIVGLAYLWPITG
jgi:hypothetical protein